jgi:replicative DNA helicase
VSLIENAEFYQTRILQGLFCKANSDQERNARVREACSQLYEEHFTGRNRAVFHIITTYFYQTYALVSPNDFMDAIRAADDSSPALVYEFQQLLLSFRYGEMPSSSQDPGTKAYLTEAEFTYAIHRLKEQTQVDLYGTTLAETMEILVNGKTVNKEHLQGFDAARFYYSEKLQQIEHVGAEELPQGTVNDEAEEIKAEYAKLKHGDSTIFRVQTGITEIDNLTGGGAPGELWMISGYCQPAGELVLTKNGFVPIEEVKVGDVIPEQGRVLNTFAFPPKKIIGVHITGDGPEARFSWDHPIAVVRNDEQLLLFAQDILVGDSVLLPSGVEEYISPPIIEKKKYSPKEFNVLLKQAWWANYFSRIKNTPPSPQFYEIYVKEVNHLPEEPVYGIETESGWYYAPFLVHNTGEGKTTQCVNVAYNAMMAGKNIVFGTSETSRDQVRRKLICRHSLHSKFHNSQGIPNSKLKMGILSTAEEKLFNDVVDDLSDSTAYGRFKIQMLPRKCTVDYFTGMLAKYEAEFFIHMAIWDELRLGSSRGRRDWREELNDIIRDAKQMAVTHRHKDSSTGVLLLAPYQIPRIKWQEAKSTGRYDKSCLADTAEAERTADLIWSHLQRDEQMELTCQVLKYRDGNDRIPEFRLEWRPEQSYLASIATNQDDLLLEG